MRGMQLDGVYMRTLLVVYDSCGHVGVGWCLCIRI